MYARHSYFQVERIGSEVIGIVEGDKYPPPIWTHYRPPIKNYMDVLYEIETMSKILSLSKIEPVKSEELFFRDMAGIVDWESESAFMDAWNSLVNQYHQKMYNIEEYESRPDANLQYAAREKAFLISLGKMLNAIKHEMKLRREAEKARHRKLEGTKEFESFLLDIIKLHGINLSYFIAMGRGFTISLLHRAKESNAVRLPDEFQKQFPK